jgi:hypothetical protein
MRKHFSYLRSMITSYCHINKAFVSLRASLMTYTSCWLKRPHMRAQNVKISAWNRSSCRFVVTWDINYFYYEMI